MHAFDQADCARDLGRVVRVEFGRELVLGADGGEVRALHHVANHADQAHQAAVLDRVQALDAGVVQLLDLGVGDGAAAAAEDLDVATAALLE